MRHAVACARNIDLTLFDGPRSSPQPRLPLASSRISVASEPLRRHFWPLGPFGPSFRRMSDRAEAVESLFATTVWQSGLNDPKYLLSVNQIGNFKKGLKVPLPRW